VVKYSNSTIESDLYLVRKTEITLERYELTTQEMMKKARATMPKLSLQVRPTAMIPAANCHVAALKASEIQ
jgi:hypothetical protein